MKVAFPVTDLEKKAFEIGVCQISAVRLAKKMNDYKKGFFHKHDNSMIENLRKTDDMNKEMLFRVMKICEREGISLQMRRKFLDTAKSLSQEEQDSVARNSPFYASIELELLSVWEVLSA